MTGTDMIKRIECYNEACNRVAEFNRLLDGQVKASLRAVEIYQAWLIKQKQNAGWLDYRWRYEKRRPTKPLDNTQAAS